MSEQKIQILQNGEIVFNEGEFARCMYDLLQGKIGIYANYGTAQQKLLTELEPGASFGEMGMLEFYPRSATAVALAADTQVAVIDEESFKTYFTDNEGKVLAIMRQLSSRTRAMTEDYAEVCRTIAANEGAKESGKRENWLMASLKKFADIYAQYGCNGNLYY